MTTTTSETLMLRDYQQQVIEDARARWRERPVIVAPTGAGKTVIGGEIVRRAVARGRRVLWLAHREELIEQAASRIARSGVGTAIIMAGRRENRAEPVQVASIQSLVRREYPVADLVVIDEAHHARASTYRRVLEAYPGAAIIGLTATPFRSDGKGLGDVFGAICVAATAADLVESGALLEPRFFAPYTPDLKGVRKRGGDYSDSDLAAVMDKPHLVGDVVATWKARASDRRTVVFATTVAHSQHIVSAFVEAGVAARHIDGETPKAERAAILADLASGRVQVVSNCAVLTEGWDLPALSCAVFARPTASLGLYLQCVGRVMRPAPGKQDAMVLDHAGNVLRHGLPTEDLEYSLEDGVLRREGQRKPTKTCPACFAVVPVRWRQCGCGFVFGREIAVEQRSGDLAEIVAPRKRDKTPMAARVAWFEPIVAQAVAGGFKPGWAGRQYRERYGVWPRGEAHAVIARAKKACPHVRLDIGACRFCGARPYGEGYFGPGA